MGSLDVVNLMCGVAIGDGFYDAVSAYESGDYATAADKFRELAAQGDQEAQYNLTRMVMEGRGTEKDKEVVNQHLKELFPQCIEDISPETSVSS